MTPGPAQVATSDAGWWAVIAIGWFGGWSTFWAAVWMVAVVGEHNDESAADEEFALAFAASFAVAISVTAWAASLAVRQRVAGWWPAGTWVLGFVGAAIFLGLYIVWANARQMGSDDELTIRFSGSPGALTAAQRSLPRDLLP